MWKKIMSLFTREEQESFKEKIKKIIIEAQKNERVRADAEWERKMDQREKELIREHEFILAEKEAEVFQLVKRCAELENQVVANQVAYEMYSEESIKLNRLYAETKHQIERLFNRSGDIYQVFVNLQDSFTTHEENFLKNDLEIRQLLGMNEKRLLKRTEK